VNPLSVSEEKRLLLLLTKCASLVSARKLILRPYFQDYELVNMMLLSLPNSLSLPEILFSMDFPELPNSGNNLPQFLKGKRIMGQIPQTAGLRKSNL
jgi:hypothetical protein